MDSLAESLKLQEIKISNKQEIILYLTYSALAFIIPFSIGQPQLLVGSIVNAALILAALNLKSYKILPVILLPSLAVLARGLVFGPLTVFLIYTIPFIWIGNALLVVSLKYLFLAKKFNRFLTCGIGIIAKTAFLYFTAILLIKGGFLPKTFSVSMGIFQLYTAIIGTALALLIQKTAKLKETH